MSDPYRTPIELGESSAEPKPATEGPSEKLLLAQHRRNEVHANMILCGAEYMRALTIELGREPGQLLIDANKFPVFYDQNIPSKSAAILWGSLVLWVHL